MSGEIWTTDDFLKLKRLWRDGNTAWQISREIGRSRNAVIGKLHRHGLLGKLTDADLRRRISVGTKEGLALSDAERFPTAQGD